MNTEELYTRFWNARFDAERGVRFHMSRYGFWAGLSLFSQFSGLVLIFCSVGLIMSSNTAFAVAANLIVAAASLAVIIFKSERRARFNDSQRRDHYAILNLIPADHANYTERLLQDIEAHVNAIYARDKNDFQCLNVICHNELCRANGIDDLWELSWVEEHIGSWMPIKYRTNRKKKQG